MMRWEVERGPGREGTIVVKKSECFHGPCPSKWSLARSFSQRAGSVILGFQEWDLGFSGSG